MTAVTFLDQGVDLYRQSRFREAMAKAQAAPFIVYALPRSRTAWLSAFLSYGEWTCHHDALARVATLADLRRVLTEPYTGICETALGFAGDAMRRLVPNARTVVVRRDVSRIAKSLSRFGMDVPPSVLREEVGHLERISREPGTLTVSFDDLNTEDGCRRVFEHCLGLPFDRDWWLTLRDTNIQVDIRRSYEIGIAHRPFIQAMKQESAVICGVPTIQNESWDDFFRDGQDLIAEHVAEVGAGAEYPFDPDYDLAAAAYRLGMLQITTARIGGEMVGYILCQIERHIECKSMLRGIQIPFFVRKPYRGRTGLRLHAYMRKSLIEKGVSVLTMRSGIRGVGERQEALFRRLGAKEDGRMFTLRLEA